MKCLVRWVVAASVFGIATFAAAGSLQLARSDGGVVAVVGGVGAAAGRLQLEERNADGSLDTRFGRDGRVAFTLGRDSRGASSLHADARGRLLVVGTATAWDGRAVPSIVRFLPSGQPDGSWGVQGRSATAVRDSDARGVDLFALPNGGALLLGQIESRAGAQVALWRLSENGRFDTSFGRGGVMDVGEFGKTEALSVQRDTDGSALIATTTYSQGSLWLSVHRWRPGADETKLVSRLAARPGWRGPPVLDRRDGSWQWFDGGSNAVGLPMQPTDTSSSAVAYPSTVQMPNDDAARVTFSSSEKAVFNPFATGATAPPARLEAPMDTSPELPWTMITLVMTLAAVAWWWMRRPATIDLGLLDAQRRQVDDAVWALKLAGLRSRENEPGRPSSSTWLDAVPAVPAAAAPASEGEALEESPAPPSRDDDCLESTASDADAPEALPARPSVLEGVLAGTSAARGTDGPAACASGIAASTGCHNRLAGPDNGTPDDLKRIKGIGPKLEMLLHHEGIFHFWQIAQWSHDDVDLISSRLRTFTGRIERDGWVRQACALAEPDDLKRIKGIGPKLERLLRDEGIYLFWQIAHWSREDVSSMSSRLPSFKGRIERDGWVRQARALTGVEPSTPPSES